MNTNFVDEIFEKTSRRIEYYHDKLSMLREDLNDGAIENWEVVFFQLNSPKLYGSEEKVLPISIVHSEQVSKIGLVLKSDEGAPQGVRGYKVIKKGVYSAFVSEQLTLSALSLSCNESIHEYLKRKSKAPQTMEEGDKRGNIHYQAKLQKLKSQHNILDANKTDENKSNVFFGGLQSFDLEKIEIVIMQTKNKVLMPVHLELKEELLCDIRILPQKTYNMVTSEYEIIGTVTVECSGYLKIKYIDK